MGKGYESCDVADELKKIITGECEVDFGDIKNRIVRSSIWCIKRDAEG